MLNVMRNPMIRPAPTLSRLYEPPTAIRARITPCSTWPAASSAHGASRLSGITGISRVSSRNSITSADTAAPHITALNARSALRRTGGLASRGGSITMMVSAAAAPSAYASFSSTTKCRRSGTASSTPSVHAVASHRNDIAGVSRMPSAPLVLWCRRSNAPSSTHMNAVCAALVPAASTRLFCQRS